MAIPIIAARSLNIAKNLITSSKTMAKGVYSTASSTVNRTGEKIKSTNAKIVAEKKKQADINRKKSENESRAAKENNAENTSKKKGAALSLVGVVKKSIMGFWKIIGAWLLDNLPRIIEEVRKFVKKIRIVGAAIKRAVTLVGSVFSSIGKIAKAVVKNILNFDFNDKSGEIRAAREELDASIDGIGSSISEIGTVWGREEDDLDYILTQLQSNQNLEDIRKNILSEFPEVENGTSAFGDGSSPSSGGMIEMSADEQQLTESLIAGEEGVKTKAYQDSEGIWTIGYGQTRINGRPVKPGDTISKAQALSGFRGAVTEHQQRAISQLGEDRWLKLDPRSRAVLSSIAYNYGSIPKRILVAAKTGSAEDIAVAMNSLYGDNGGDLRGRREREQSILRGNFKGSSTNPTRLDKDFMAGGQFAGSGTGPMVMSPSPQPQSQSPQPANGSTGTTVNDEYKGGMSKSIVKTSGYGMRKHPISGVRKMHKGIDIAPPGPGYKVALKVPGKVTRVTTQRGYGNFVIITSQQTGMSYMFAHLKTAYVRQGDAYTGQAIGEIGSTGLGTGIHLHFEVYKGGKDGPEVNPEPYVNLLSIGRGMSKQKAATTKANNLSSAKSEELTQIASRRTGGTQIVNNTTLLKQDRVILTG